MDKLSKLGYSKGSPYRNRKFIDINSPEGLITMRDTDIDLLGVDNFGNMQYMKAGNPVDYSFPGNIIREIPLNKKRGAYKQLGGLINYLFEDDFQDTPVQKENTAPSEEEPKVQNRYSEDYLSALYMALQDNDQNRERYNLNSTSYTKGSPSKEHLDKIGEVSDKYGVPAEILAGIYGAETSYGRNVNTSTAGAQGYFQFMPATGRQYNVDPNDFNSSAEGAAKYMKDLYKMFGDWESAVAAYNAGPGNIKKGRIPAETRNYIPKVFNNAQMMKKYFNN